MVSNKRLRGNPRAVEKCLLESGPDVAVIDEGHLIKNERNDFYEVVAQIKTKRRIILSGTPSHNDLIEFYKMIEWVKPSCLGTADEFRTAFVDPIRDGQLEDSTSDVVHSRDASVLKELLPEKLEYFINVPSTKLQEKLYEQYLHGNRTSVGERSTNYFVLHETLRKIWTHPKAFQKASERTFKTNQKKPARQSMAAIQTVEAASDDDDEATDEDNNLEDFQDILGQNSVQPIVNSNSASDWWKPFLTNDDFESIYASNKFILLFEILKHCEQLGEKVLVFSPFVATVEIIQDFMKKIHNRESDPNSEKLGYNMFAATWEHGEDYLYLDGKTSIKKRHQMVQRFNDESNRRLRCFLISSKAGGPGDPRNSFHVC